MAIKSLLDRLNSVPFALRLSHRVIPLDPATAARLIRRHQVQWFMKRQGATDLVRGAVSRQRQAQTHFEHPLQRAVDEVDIGAEAATDSVPCRLARIGSQHGDPRLVRRRPEAPQNPFARSSRAMKENKKWQR